MPVGGSPVIADTSVLQYLLQIGDLDLLPTLFGQVIVPVGVARELATGRAHGFWVPDPADYDWMQVRPADVSLLPADCADIGLGEREATALALQSPGSLLLLDDAKAKAYAEALGAQCTGTLGVLVLAKERGLVPEVTSLVDRLQSAGFRLRSATRARVLRLVGE